jgi:ferredoxin
MSLPVEEMVKKNNMQEPECILCGSCIDTCPKNSPDLFFKRVPPIPARLKNQFIRNGVIAIAYPVSISSSF